MAGGPLEFKQMQALVFRARGNAVRAEARKTSAEADSIDLKNLQARLEILKSLETTLGAEDVQPVLTAMDALSSAGTRVMIDVTPKVSSKA